MVASSILPITMYRNKLYFLFGKENALEKYAPGFSDFGGRVNPGETLRDAALREGAEELTGFLGDKTKLSKLVVDPLVISSNKYHVHFFFIEYDANLPKYFNQNHRFLWENMNSDMLSNRVFFEKIEIDWFSAEDIEKRRHEFRPFYRNILDVFVKEMPRIRKFAEQRNPRKKQQNTRKNAPPNDDVN